ncbi:WD40/YVTN/BNR-like repeat-containing protein [Stackebrandtia nassauensis]|uniref:Photosynthesis system II assembly factor Ycf48/Hcf136-like domain-containing protein n=1 Tax=Stackebrandtia nassauensis (strain DSM 44728 / CIP 108903 / NRRL B-16338 / NBRC 102104 / LLR-40K-21) TaxID=446470 RepID=D3Q9Q1_STANL|nr:conserved hypothetical protein [Stackebrandtia nassauensis DSM 44728]
MNRVLKRHVLPVCVATASLAAITLATPAHAHDGFKASNLSWQLTDTGVDNQFRGLAAVDDDTAWVAGTKGTVLRTTDGGDSWDNVSPAGAEGLEFRDIEAYDDEHAVALSIGEGEASRVYVTDDGGDSWHNSFTNAEPKAFYDCMAFFDAKHGVAMSDPVDGRIRFITTDDGGHSWDMLPPERSPEALAGEFAFAASGQCLVAADKRNGYLVTGGGETARVIHTPDRGQSWEAHDTPVASGPSAGIYAAAFRDTKRAILVGGDYTTPDAVKDAAAYTRKGVENFALSPGEPGQYRSSVAYVAGSIAITVGPTGSDLTVDNGRDWHRFDDGAFDSVECAKFACWASGPKGRIATLELG